jgi:hypothetical protein
MLEQAIVDAEALKNAALKNAETIILEKYSNEIKKAVSTLLEQPEEDLSDLSEEPEVSTEKFMEDLPLAHMEDEDVEIDINLSKLAAELQDDTDPEEVIGQEIDSLPTASPELEQPVTPPLEPTTAPLAENEEEETLEEDETDELDEQFIANVLEKLSIDVKNVPTGQPGGGSNETLDRENEEIALAQEDLEEGEDDEEKKDLEESVNKLKKEKNVLLEQNQKYKDVVLQLKDTLEQVNLSNARLLYTNRVLDSASLNERQKTKIVEALSNADSVEGAKVIYETLQSAVGSSHRRSPKSLSEAVTRNSSTTLPRRKEEDKSTPFSDRWKTLAGIK